MRCAGQVVTANDLLVMPPSVATSNGSPQMTQVDCQTGARFALAAAYAGVSSEPENNSENNGNDYASVLSPLDQTREDAKVESEAKNEALAAVEGPRACSDIDRAAPFDGCSA